MGQQQLLILVLVAIIVGIAIYGATHLMEAYNQSSERDVIIHRLNYLVAEAKKYAEKPTSLGGGAGSFRGFVPAAMLTVTNEMTISTTAGDTWVLFQGIGKTIGEDGRTPVQIVGQFDKPTDKWTTLIKVN
ncbi:MAG: hypothetical protein HY966_01300 [Ignavibacteriales bacterium]|nr:hypothetical protein [Ignavibacteriales bacterium]